MFSGGMTQIKMAGSKSHMNNIYPWSSMLYNLHGSSHKSTTGHNCAKAKSTSWMSVIVDTARFFFFFNLKHNYLSQLDCFRKKVSQMYNI